MINHDVLFIWERGFVMKLRSHTSVISGFHLKSDEILTTHFTVAIQQNPVCVYINEKMDKASGWTLSSRILMSFCGEVKCILILCQQQIKEKSYKEKCAMLIDVF